MILAAPSLVRGLQGRDRRSPSGFSNMVQRGMGQGMQSAVVGKNGGANITTLIRFPVTFPFAVRRMKIILPTFESTGSPIKDALLSGSSAVLNFQAGLEFPYATAVTGIAPRSAFRWKGALFRKWDAAVDLTPFVESDWLDPGRWIIGRAGIWLAVELPAGVYNNALPYMVTATNNNERYVGQQFSGSSIIAGAGGGSDSALTASSITKLGTTQTGVTGIYLPAFIVVECNESIKIIAAMGDSLSQGNNEGQAGSGAFGDSMGSPLSNNGFSMRGIFETAGLCGFNLSRGSDGVKFTFDPVNWEMRAQLLARGNPTHVLNAYGTNDVAATITISGWAQNTAYAIDAVASANSGIWIARNAGTSLGTGTGPTGAGPTFNDNGIIWDRAGGFPGTANPRGYAQLMAWNKAFHRQIRLVVPRAKIIKTTIPPDATSADQGITQTASTGWGDATSRRGLTDAEIRAVNSIMNFDGFIDINPGAEDSYLPTETGKWVTDGNANYVWSDHSHPNSRGQSLLAANITADKFAA